MKRPLPNLPGGTYAPPQPRLERSRRLKILLPWSLPLIAVALVGIGWGAAAGSEDVPPWVWYALVGGYVVLLGGYLRLSAEERRLRHWYWSGACLRCGYDLRGNKAADHCPECGTPLRERA